MDESKEAKGEDVGGEFKVKGDPRERIIMFKSRILDKDPLD